MIDAWLDTLPPPRREAVSALRRVLLDNLPDGYEERFGGSSLGYVVPHAICPAGYHCNPSDPVPFASLVNGKAKISLHLFGLYVMPGAAEAFREAWRATGKRLDMGASCVRFKKLEDVPLEVVAEAVRVPVADFLAQYEANLPERVRAKRR